MHAQALTLVLIRRFLGVVFIAYGLVKLFGGQFVYSDWTITRSTASGPFLVWAFYGFSPTYAKFIALCELIPGILLLFPRTAFVGAVALFPVALNITVMDFAYGFPGVKYLVAAYTALLALLIWVEREKIWLMFHSIERVRAGITAAEAVPVSPAPVQSATVRWSIGALSTLFLLWVANMIVEVSTDGPEPRAIAHANANGRALALKRSRITGQSGIGRTAVVQLRTEGDTTAAATVYLTRPVGFVPWRVDSLRAIPSR
jgi:uncharacterized membrane protein YphA (DoxX/SURF4 family)